VVDGAALALAPWVEKTEEIIRHGLALEVEGVEVLPVAEPARFGQILRRQDNVHTVVMKPASDEDPGFS
jgi:hypothetical protein